MEVGYRLNGRYRVCRSLGQGGFGITYLAEDELLGQKIVIKESKNNVIIEQDDIIYIESIARKRCVYTEKQEYLTLESLAYWKKLLDDDMFFLVNKSIIVNIKKVEQFSNNNIRLKGIEQEIPLSRDRKSEFKQKLLLYLAGQE